MKTIKKIVAAFLAGVIAVTALCAVAGAENILETKNTLPNGKKITLSCSGSNRGDKNVIKDYKLKLSKSGKLSISYTIDSLRHTYLYLFDSDGAAVKNDVSDVKSGTCHYNSSMGMIDIGRNTTTNIGKGKIEYNLNKGTYYLRVNCDKYNKGKFQLTPK